MSVQKFAKSTHGRNPQEKKERMTKDFMDFHVYKQLGEAERVPVGDDVAV